jgi:outer membrane cobalamin receptor
LVTGHIHTPSGAPLSGVHVTLHAQSVTQTTSDAGGAFSLQAQPGDYQLDFSAKGYVSASIDINVDHDAKVDVALEPVDAPTLRTIAIVSIDGRLTPVRGAIPSVTVTRADMDRMGDDRLIDALMTLPGTTFTRPDGGSAASITVVSLRGPDPSESIDALDGQQLNDGNTGDLNLAAFSSLNVTEGLGPQDSNGSNTFGGSINMVSLRPTQDPHWAFSESFGSFGQSEVWLNATGTQSKLGYAFALDDTNAAGHVNEPQTLYAFNAAPACPGTCSPIALGSSYASHAALANLQWNFSQRSNVTARVFVLGDNSDESSSVNGIDETIFPGTPPVPSATYGLFSGTGNQSLAQTIRAYQVREQSPLGAGTLASDVYVSDNNVAIDGAQNEPMYDVDHVDKRYNLGMQWGRSFDTSQFAFGGYTRYEDLQILGPAAEATPLLGQSINVLFARGGFQASKELQVDAGVYESHYTSFGANLDGRLGLIYNTSPATALRFSIGTGFRAPLLIERYQFPYAQLTQDANGVWVGQGNPNEQPEHATEYELGVSHQFSSSTLDVSLYQTNLRNPIEIYYPYAYAVPANGTLPCTNTTTNNVDNVDPNCVSYNSNVGNAVYQGLEARFVQHFAPQHLYLTAMYGLNVAYPKDLNAEFSNPTSGGSLVANQQFPGIAQQQGSLQLDWSQDAWHAAASATFTGKNNDLNQPPFTFVNATVGYHLSDTLDLSLVGTNLFSDAANRYTYLGGGVPYAGAFSPVLTNQYNVEPFGLRFVLTLRSGK